MDETLIPLLGLLTYSYEACKLGIKHQIIEMAFRGWRYNNYTQSLYQHGCSEFKKKATMSNVISLVVFVVKLYEK
ncbi:IS1-like element transposase [Enterobacter bugandensis]|uniref:IS1-like element transposase n=1 Tax=Enterobacter bugandensis TaxID=881260 RepID=UPI003C7C1F32